MLPPTAPGLGVDLDLEVLKPLAYAPGGSLYLTRSLIDPDSAE